MVYSTVVIGMECGTYLNTDYKNMLDFIKGQT